ncbi:hypothetical protein Dimus_010651 [Dionaea muscipula]
MDDKNSYPQKMLNIKKEKHASQTREKKWILPGNVRSIAKQLQHKKSQHTLLQPDKGQHPSQHPPQHTLRDHVLDNKLLNVIQNLKKDKLVPQQPLVHHLQAPTKDKGKVVDQLPIEREQNMQIDQEIESTTQHKLPQELDVENPQELVAELPQQTDGHERVTAKKRKRGRTMKQGIHVRGLEDRDSIIVNPYFQPVGPDEKIITDFSEFLGTVARMSNLCPLNLEKWTDMNKFYKGAKERIWEYVKKRWIVPESARKWVLQTVGADWRTFKCRLKKKHYKPYKNNKMRWKNRPTEVSAEHFKWLLKKWDDPKDKDRAKVNALNRAKVTNVHTCGPKSFALIRERLKNANEDKKEPTSVEMFKATVQMEALQSQQCGENVESVDPFVAVLGNEHRVRLYGRGVTSSSIRKTSSGNESGGNSAFVNVPDGLLQKLTAQVTEQVTAVLADKFSLTMAYHLKQISPQYNVDPEALKRLLLTPGDASSAQIHQSPHVNTSSSVNANEASK